MCNDFCYCRYSQIEMTPVPSRSKLNQEKLDEEMQKGKKKEKKVKKEKDQEKIITSLEEERMEI